MNDRIIEIKKLQSGISDSIESRKRKRKKTVLDHIAINALAGTAKRLQNIEEILNVPRYDLVFIGQVGAGKTTAICHLFDLIQEFKGSKNLSNGRTKSVTKIRELLSTGAGQTTICEVIIKPSERTYLEIEPYDPKNLEELIREFALYFWLREYPCLDNDGVQPPPTELMRAIRNVVDLNVSTDKEVGRIDAAAELVKEFDPEQFEDFQNEILRRANLEKRTNTKIVFDADPNKEDEKTWLRKTFEQLNLAKKSDTSIPKKIYVYISSDIFYLDAQFSRIGSIIDTKGMHVGQTREDLDNYIRENSGALCLFSEKFPPAPTNVADLIERHFVSTDIASKFVLFVMPHKGEPEKVVGSDGPVEDYNEGLELRRDSIEAAFTSRKIDFISDNVLFYDALAYYRSDGRPDPDYEKDDIEHERRRVFSKLNQIIARREELLWEEVQDLKSDFEDINRGDYGLSSQDKKLLKDAKEDIKGYRHLNFVTVDNFVHEYLGLWDSSRRHFMTLRAANNRFGKYEPRNIDIYYDAVPITENLARQVMKGPKSGIIKSIQHVGQNGSSDLCLLMEALEKQLIRDYQQLILEIGREAKRILENKILAPGMVQNSRELD